MAAVLDVKITFLIPALLAALRALIPPMIEGFIISFSGFLAQLWYTAATWKRPSIFCMADSIVSGFIRSISTNSMFSEPRWETSFGLFLSLTDARTLYPFSTNILVRVYPTCPLAPVTSTLFPLIYLNKYFR